jgi:hypothetical protein
MSDYDEAGIVTVIGERHIAQYRLVYRYLYYNRL